MAEVHPDQRRVLQAESLRSTHACRARTANGGRARRWRSSSGASGSRTLPADAAAAARVLPDGCVDIVAASDGRRFIAGPDTCPVLHELAAGTIVTGLRFRIAAAGTGLGVPAAELRDVQVPLDALWSARASEQLGERLAGADGTGGRLAALQDADQAHLTRACRELSGLPPSQLLAARRG